MSAILLLRAPLLRTLQLWRMVGGIWSNEAKWSVVVYKLLTWFIADTVITSYCGNIVFTLFHSPLSQAPFWPWHSEGTLHFCQHLLAVWEGKWPPQWWVERMGETMRGREREREREMEQVEQNGIGEGCEIHFLCLFRWASLLGGAMSH